MSMHKIIIHFLYTLLDVAMDTIFWQARFETFDFNYCFSAIFDSMKNNCTQDANQDGGFLKHRDVSRPLQLL